MLTRFRLRNNFKGMSKDSTKAALMRYYERQLPSDKPHRKNEKPEKEVEAAVLAWCRSRNWFLQVFEAKSVFSEQSQRYISATMKAGTPDLVGITNCGVFVAIELKAPGRRSTLRPRQREFLLEIIKRGGFGVVVDSVSMLEKAWLEFTISTDPLKLLTSFLPKEKAEKSALFFED